MQRPCAPGRRHAAWRLRARCGSNAPQSGESRHRACTDGFRRNRLKIDQKSTKIDQKSTKILPGLMGYPPWADGVPLFWSRAQVVLDLGALLGSSWKRPETVLEASWAVLGRERWPTWVQLGFQNAAKIDEKSVPKLINLMIPLGIGICRFFNDFGSQKPSHVA